MAFWRGTRSPKENSCPNLPSILKNITALRPDCILARDTINSSLCPSGHGNYRVPQVPPPNHHIHRPTLPLRLPSERGVHSSALVYWAELLLLMRANSLRRRPIVPPPRSLK